MENQKSCLNCKHFKRYYILNVSLRFVPTDNGFCIKRKCKGGDKRKVAQNESCELWQSDELQKLRSQYLAENVLRDISKKLEAIRALLDEDDCQDYFADNL